MVININPARINTGSVTIERQGVGQRETARESRPVTPRKADENIIPAPETLSTMIRSAVQSMRQGTFWERGTILNLVV